jgi:hypothetical protein
MEKRDPFPVFPYEVTVSGPYPALQDYVSQLESLPALTAIHNLKILARRGDDAAVEASFIIDRYDLGEDHPVPGVIALFPAGRTNAFSPPAGMAAATDGTKGTAVPPGQEGAAGSQVTSSAAAAGAGTLPAGSPLAPGSPKGAGTPPADKLTAPFSPAGEGTLPAEQPPAAALPPPAGNTTANPASSPVLASPAGAGGPPQYTFPRQAEGRLLPGPAFKEPPAGEQDIWLEELRVLRNVGPFFILDRPAALAGMNLGRSIGVNLSNGHNKAELKVDLRGRYSHLQGYAGIDDSAANSSGKVKVTVFADGRRLYQEEIRPGDYPRYLELPLFAVQQLTFNLEWLAEGIGDYDQLLATLASIHFSCRH